jgi:tetratricopeptide (TPR) repeat protein
MEEVGSRSNRTMAGKWLQAVLCSLALSAGSAAVGQTFELNLPAPSPTFPTKQKPKSASRQTPKSEAAQNAETGIGWGSGIEVARNARAAQQALQKNDYNGAVAYATRAANSAPQNTALWFLLGYAARLAGKYQISIDAYQRGLKAQPSSIQGLSGLAQTYARAGRQAEAQEALNKVLAANPKSVNDLLLAGELSLSSDPKIALELLKRGDALKPSPRSELLIARAYQRLNQPLESKQFLDRAVSRAPKDPDVLRAVASFYRDTKQYDQAISTLQKAATYPKSRAVLPELAYTYQVAGKRKEAAETYSKAASSAPNDAALQLSAAQALVNVGQFDRAGSFLKRAEARDASSYRLHAIRGQIASLSGRNDEAISEFRVALDHLPQGVPEGPLYPISLRLSLYQLYQATDQGPAAQNELQAAQAAMAQITGVEDTSRPEFLRLRALLEAASNNTDAAEKDLKEALAIDPQSVNIMLNYANLLWKTNRKQDAFQLYDHVLGMDPNNHAALTAMGYLAREVVDPAAAEQYFIRLASLYPRDYVPYLALGDLYTAGRQFDRAQANYEKAYELAPRNPLVYSGATNSALEAHQLPLAKQWLDRAEANAAVNQVPQVMRERERYLTWTGHYEESAALGYKVLEKLPRDPEAPVYLAYDLLFLNKHEEAAQLAEKYKAILPKDKDLWLITGYVHTHNDQLQEAVNDFTKALELDPKIATAYMNRGFVLNDLKEPTRAAQDFQAALKLRPDYGAAHLGLAFADLQLRRARPALKEVNLAAKIMGESRATHMARAEAFRQQILLRQAEGEYQAALKLAPDDIQVRLALADTIYRLHRYNDSIEVLKAGLGGKSDDQVYAQMARNYAQLNRQQEALQAITNAEQTGGNNGRVLMATGEALMILGNPQAAMDRYTRALDIQDSDRVGTRLALARLFAQGGHPEEAHQQISLGFAESRVGEANPITAEHLLQAAQVLVSIAEFDVAKKYFERAQTEGADEQAVAIGLTNTYLALGETHSASQTIRSFGNNPENYENYEYLIAMGNVYRQEHDTMQALAAFARANQLVQGNPSTEKTELRLAEQEGRQVMEILSVHPQVSLSPVFEDENIYTTDARLRGITDPALLPTPRSSFESIAEARYRLHLHGWPVLSGLVGERNARGRVSFPSDLLIQDRNTYDTIFNIGVNPVLHLGQNTITFNPGLQFTVRRDTAAPRAMNQNLFRQFLYLYTSSFMNWFSISGSAMREAGPFIERDLHSRDAAARLEFAVGRPWGKTSFITGYAVRDVLFRPLVREYYTTSTYVGLQRKFGDNIRAGVFAEYLRSWRVQDTDFALAQSMRPAFNLDIAATPHWNVHAAGSWSRGEGFHAYDNFQNQILLSYVRSVQHPLHDGIGEVPVTYPFRISFGLQQQTFYNFAGSKTNTVLPVIQLNLF